MYREGRSYYDVSGVSAEDVIDGMDMLHREGAAVKYLFRCNKIMPKGNIAEDLRKCRHYISRCREYYPLLLRNNKYQYWLNKIDSSVFDEPIYWALAEMITAASVSTREEYIECLGNALDDINNALEKY